MADSDRNRAFAAARREALAAGSRIQGEAAAVILRHLREAERRIAAILAAAPSDYRVWQLTQLQRQVRQALAAIEPAAAAALGTAADRAQAAGQAVVDLPLAAGGVDIKAHVVALDTRKLVPVKDFMTARIRDITGEIADRINTELAQVIIGVQSPSDAAAKVAGMVDGGYKRAAGIVRNEVGRAFSVASQDRQRQAAAVLPGLQKQWRRSGKVHSRPEHDAIDGQIRDVDKPFDLPNGVRLMHPRDPAGPIEETINCGCSSIPHMAHWTVARPLRQPASPEERARNPMKRWIDDAL